MWCSGAALLHRHGPPAPTQAFHFLVGAVTAFAVLSIPASAVADQPLEASARAHALTGVMNLAAAAAGVGAADAVAVMSSWAVWPIASFAATMLYLLVAAAGLLLARRTDIVRTVR